jgi:hypothetical protein
MNPSSTTSVLPPRSRSEAPGSIFIPLAEPAQLARQTATERNVPMSRNLSQRLDTAFSTIAMFGLLSPLVLASVMFVVTSH